MMANSEVIKEPRGFIKFIQIIIAIFAFATTTAYYGSIDFVFNCPVSNGNETVSAGFSYPFSLNSWSKEVCNNNVTLTMRGNVSSSAQFYVFIGVMAFLYSLGALILYVFADDKYRQIDKLPAADLVITVIFVLMWLIASSAWADGVSKVKHYTYPTEIWANGEPITSGISHSSAISYASLNVSIIFGFLNMCVWAGNIWFLYKETKWFSGSSEDPSRQQPQPGSPENPQQRI